MWPFRSTVTSRFHAQRVLVTLEGESVKVILEVDRNLKRFDIVIEESARNHRVKAAMRGDVLVVEYDNTPRPRRGTITVRNTGPAIATGGIANSGIMFDSTATAVPDVPYCRAADIESCLLCSAPRPASIVTIRVSPGQLYATA